MFHPIHARLCAAAIALFCASQASAHVTIDPPQAQANGMLRAAFRVPHGCGQQATIRVTVTLPEGTTTARPMPKAGWRISIPRQPLATPVSDGHGGMITEAITQIIWEGGPLPNEHYDEFVIYFRTPNRPDETIWLPTVQHCDGGGTAAWTEIPEAGRRITDYRFPAPALRLTPARTAGGH
ncbi:MAG: hypothetical protein RLZZ57_1425 [Pseudomonadota bacterium]